MRPAIAGFVAGGHRGHVQRKFRQFINLFEMERVQFSLAVEMETQLDRRRQHSIQSLMLAPLRRDADAQANSRACTSSCSIPRISAAEKSPKWRNQSRHHSVRYEN